MRFIDLGIDGIECYYPSHTEAITNMCLEICEDRNLLITCGSDCHGEFEDTEIGEMNIPIENLKLGDILLCSLCMKKLPKHIVLHPEHL